MMVDAFQYEIRALFSRLTESWNRGDAAAYAECFTSDATYVAFDGQLYSGRDRIERSHAELFEFMKGSKLAFTEMTFRQLAPHVVLVIAEGAALLPWQTEITPGRRSINTSVAVGDETGRWLLCAFQNARIAPKPIPKGAIGAFLRAAIRLIPSRPAGSKGFLQK